MNKELDREKILDIISKINNLIILYAEYQGLKDYIKVEHKHIKIYKELTYSAKINKIYFRKYMKDVTDEKTIAYINKLDGLVSDTELENGYIELYFSDYNIIENILSMLELEIPRPLSMNDLVLLNSLYKKYKGYADTKKNK